MENAKLKFSQRHPLVFGVIMILTAVALFLGATALFRALGMGSGGSLFASDKLGIVHIRGVLTDSTDIVDWITRLKENDSVKGVLLRVDCPGGAIAPSQEIYQAVRELDQVKPVVASYATVAASGGYYSTCPARIIVANPGSLTASIGVIAEFMTFGQTLEKLGVKPEVLTTGRYKGVGTPLRDLTSEQRDQLLGLIQDFHDQFVDDVAAARDMKRDRVAAIADGRAVSGRQALALGLVDKLGGQTEAVRILKQLCEIKGKVPVLEGPEKEEPLMQKILGSLGIFPTSQYNGWNFSYK